MGEVEHKMRNWKQYNQALVNRGSVIFWIDAAAINGWNCLKYHAHRGRYIFGYRD